MYYGIPKIRHIMAQEERSAGFMGADTHADIAYKRGICECPRGPMLFAPPTAG